MAGTNDVFGSLTGTFDSALGKVLDYKLASQRIRSGAAPSGTVVNSNAQNPAPGTASAYPQNDAKPKPGGNGASGFSLDPSQWLMLGVAFVLLLVLVGGRMR